MLNVCLITLLLTGVAPGAISQHLPVALGWQTSDEGDAMSLAIEYFDPNHERSLTGDSKETQFMFAALRDVHAAVPETKALHRHIAGDFDTHSFNSLIIRSHDEYGKTLVKKDEIERLVAALASQDPQCKEYTNGHKTFTSDCTYPVDEASWLASYGIYIMRVINDWGNTTVYFRARLGDPYGLLKAIEKDPQYKQGLRGIEMDVNVPSQRFGEPSSNVMIESKAKVADFGSAFQLRFTLGWGDCPAGCISHHSWLVQFTPLTGLGTFDVRLVDEEGAPLGDDARQCLKCGAFRGE